jgi:hypothetical protein
MIHGFWLICLVIAGLMGLALYRPGILWFFLRYRRKVSPLAQRTGIVFGISLLLGAAAYSFAEPNGPAAAVGVAACVTSLALLVLWTAIVLAPRRQGVSPWVLIGKGFLWGPALGVVFGGFCAVIDQQAAGPLVGAAAIFGCVFGPWVAASAWAGNLGVFPRRSKVKGAVDSSPHDTRVDPK